jgi:hypothetical protein
MAATAAHAANDKDDAGGTLQFGAPGVALHKKKKRKEEHINALYPLLAAKSKKGGAPQPAQLVAPLLLAQLKPPPPTLSSVPLAEHLPVHPHTPTQPLTHHVQQRTPAAMQLHRPPLPTSTGSARPPSPLGGPRRSTPPATTPSFAREVVERNTSMEAMTRDLSMSKVSWLSFERGFVAGHAKGWTTGVEWCCKRHGITLQEES